MPVPSFLRFLLLARVQCVNSNPNNLVNLLHLYVLFVLFPPSWRFAPLVSSTSPSSSLPYLTFYPAVTQIETWVELAFLITGTARDVDRSLQYVPPLSICAIVIPFSNLDFCGMLLVGDLALIGQIKK
jgi:hypothetical protein